MTHRDDQSISGLSQLFGEMRPELLRFLTARLGDPGEAEDALHDLWLRIADASPGPIANGAAYLFRSAQNLCLDRVRMRRRRMEREGDWSFHHAGSAEGEPADPSPDAEALLITRAEDEMLDRAIATLPAGAGRVFRMHKIEGVSHKDIARQLGITLSGVEKHMAAAMLHLRTAMTRGASSEPPLRRQRAPLDPTDGTDATVAL